jgi:hypothetical protein
MAALMPAAGEILAAVTVVGIQVATTAESKTLLITGEAGCNARPFC